MVDSFIVLVDICIFGKEYQVYQAVIEVAPDMCPDIATAPTVASNVSNRILM